MYISDSSLFIIRLLKVAVKLRLRIKKVLYRLRTVYFEHMKLRNIHVTYLVQECIVKR